MFQREFALRLCAEPGDVMYSRLSATTSLYAQTQHLIKIGKNNFRPPPKVDSSVIRLVPIQPPPPIPFAEWDGLLRILFMRKNKTVGALFKADNVEQLLEKNYRMYCALNNIAVEDNVDMLDSNGNVEMEVDSDKPKRASRGIISKLIADVLEETALSDQRPSKMDLNDYLRLLKAFHDRHVHFA